MGLFNMNRKPDINSIASELEREDRAILLDVRTEQEYRSGHIPGSKNIPLDQLHRAKEIIKDAEAPVYVYCQSGGRSRMAASILKRSGYEQVKDLGGINRYHGKVV